MDLQTQIFSGWRPQKRWVYTINTPFFRLNKKSGSLNFLNHMHTITTHGLYIFYPIFTAVYTEKWFLLQTICVLKTKNSSFIKPKIWGLYTRAVTDQEQVIVARV